MLADVQCRTAKPKAKPYKLPDGKGLYLEVKPNGVKAWRYRFKLAKEATVKESMFAIGDYAIAPSGETADDALARRKGGRFAMLKRVLFPKIGALPMKQITPAHVLDVLTTAAKKPVSGAPASGRCADEHQSG